MRRFQKYVGVAVVATGLLVAPGLAQSGPVDPSTLSCGDFINLERKTKGSGSVATIAQMEFTQVGYWVLGYLNGFIAADGGDLVLGFGDRGVGRMVMVICQGSPHESLMSAVTGAALLTEY